MSLGFLSPAGTTGPGVVELRGAVDRFGAAAGETVVRLRADRALVLGPAPEIVGRARAAGLRAYDLTAGQVAVPVADERVLRRLTDLDPAALPAAGPVAREVPAVVLRDGDGFLLLVPRELAEYVAAVVEDAA